MSKSSPTNIAASVRERLLNVSRKSGEPLDLVLIRYALERLLYRIGLKKQKVSLPHAIQKLQEFLLLPLGAAADNKPFNQFWEAGGPWKEQ